MNLDNDQIIKDAFSIGRYLRKKEITPGLALHLSGCIERHGPQVLTGLKQSNPLNKLKDELKDIIKSIRSSMCSK